jgi:branched-subunit amino acid aminotransferase/4-amino-4-deoxychorismate lyase
MRDGVHVRLMVTHGLRSTPNQDPRFVVSGPTIVIVPEYKRPRPEVKARGLALFTSTFRTSPPDIFDMRLNSHSRLALIRALLQAIGAGADEALMLDPRGFVASCNPTNFFLVRRGELWTSTGLFCFCGITRRTVLRLWREAGNPARECDFTLAEVYSADEAFVTGTLGGITPVTRIDGRPIGDGRPDPVTRELEHLYAEKVLGGADGPPPTSSVDPANARGSGAAASLPGRSCVRDRSGCGGGPSPGHGPGDAPRARRSQSAFTGAPSSGGPSPGSGSRSPTFRSRSYSSRAISDSQAMKFQYSGSSNDTSGPSSIQSSSSACL